LRYLSNFKDTEDFYHNEVEWQNIKDFRNIIAHNYFGIDPNFRVFVNLRN